MMCYKGFYILEEDDFIYHFLKETNKNHSLVAISRFDKTEKEYVGFKRKIVINNLLNPCTDWESKLPKDDLKKLNQLRISNIKEGVPQYQDFEEKELIFYNSEKGEVTRKYKEKGVVFYSIKVGKTQLSKIHPSMLHKRTDVRKHLETITENPEYKTWKTEKLLSELSSIRKDVYSYSYNSNERELKYWQLKKELATRPHIKRKGKEKIKTY